MTRSGWYAASAAATAASNPVRSAWSDNRTTNVGSPARSARASPSVPSRSAPAATTAAPYAGSAQASRSAWRLVPAPDTSTTSRAVTTGSLLGSYGRDACTWRSRGNDSEAIRTGRGRQKEVLVTTPPEPPQGDAWQNAPRMSPEQNQP